jgi:hypothetical protein
VPTVHADALRLRLFDFDIFFFGTAMTFLLRADGRVGGGRPCVRVDDGPTRTQKVIDAP